MAKEDQKKDTFVREWGVFMEVIIMFELNMALATL
jgi:hypothetical protein